MIGQVITIVESCIFFHTKLKKSMLAPTLKPRCMSSYVESCWINMLCKVSSYILSYKLCIFAYLVIYQGLLTKLRLSKCDFINFIDDKCPICSKLESINQSYFLEVKLLVNAGNKFSRGLHLCCRVSYWVTAILGDSSSLNKSLYDMLWQCVHIATLYSLQISLCKCIFYDFLDLFPHF